MPKEFDRSPADSKRPTVDDSGAVPVHRPLQQSPETLTLNYDWIGQFQSQHPDYSFVKNEEIPWTDLKVDLFEARVALVTTAMSCSRKTAGVGSWSNSLPSLGSNSKFFTRRYRSNMKTPVPMKQLSVISPYFRFPRSELYGRKDPSN